MAFLLQRGAESVEGVTARRDGRVGEHADPAHAGEDDVFFFAGGGVSTDDSVSVGWAKENGVLVLELRFRLDSPFEIQRLRGRGFQYLLGRFLPWNLLLQERLLLVREESNVDKYPHKLREPLKSERSSDDSRRLGNIIALFVRRGITVRVCNEGESRIRGVVPFRRAHELGAGDIDDFAVLVVFGGVAQGEKDTTTGPGELVTFWWGLTSALEWCGESKSTEWVVTGFRSWETAAVAEKTCDFAAGLVDFGDSFHRLRVVSLTGLGICIAMCCDIRKGGQYPDLDCWKP